MTALVFVSTELSPFTPGGIGRVLHNILKSLSDADRARSVVLLVDTVVNPEAFAAVFPGVRLLQLDTTQDASRYAHGHRVPPDWAFSDTRSHWRSASVMLAIESLAREVSIEYVEFPDWGGLAFCTLQERLFSGLLSGACLAVRLHSTHTALLNAEARPVLVEDLNISDLERKCLRDCDRIVAQLPRLAELVRDQLAFPLEEWDGRVVIHAPPVLLDHHAPAARATNATPSQSLLFTSKVQRVKRPDLFVRGVSAYMRKHPAYLGKACLSASRNDEAYTEKIDKLIPADLRSRFEAMPHMTQRERESAIADATVVVPGAYESFCLAAYEASLLGARVILNARNPAFDDASPWRDGVNCFKFDGTATGLAQAIERNFSSNESLAPVQLRNDPWPWADLQRSKIHDGDVRPALSDEAGLKPEAAVSIVVPHFNLGEYLCETLENILAIDHQNIEIIVVDDASTDEGSIKVVETLARLDEPRLKVVRLVGNVGLAAARNIGIQRARGAYLLTLDADDLIAPGFVGQAVRALERHSQFDVVITPAAYFIDGEVPPMGGMTDAVDYAVFTGEAKTAGLLQNRFSTATALFRRTALERFPYDEDLHCYEDWSLYMRMCDAGLRFIVTTDVFFFYRRRRDSMVHAPRGGAAKHIDYSDLLRTSAPAAFRKGSMHLMLGLSSPTIAEGVSAGRSFSGTPIEELLHRTAAMEKMLQSVLHATTPFAKIFRLPRYFWTRLLPLRKAIARARGRV